MFNPLTDRRISGFPLSIGTSLAFESLFESKLPPYDPNRELPPKVDINNYEEIWINLYTLFRNIVGSITKESFLSSKQDGLLDVLKFEIEFITSLLQIEGRGICKPIFYYCDFDNYSGFNYPLPFKLRLPSTEYQKVFILKYKDIMKRIINFPGITSFKGPIKHKKQNTCLILTHIPFDLLSYKQFNKLDLIESHTGVLKTRNQWYTKYYPVADGVINGVPFNKSFLYILGDNIMFHPMSLNIRKMLVSVSENRHWTSMTTDEKIVLDLSLLQDKMLYELFKLYKE